MSYPDYQSIIEWNSPQQDDVYVLDFNLVRNGNIYEMGPIVLNTRYESKMILQSTRDRFIGFEIYDVVITPMTPQKSIRM